MTLQQALEHYNQLTGACIAEKDLGYVEKACIAVNSILKVAEMVERAGGELKSRQTMATIIYFAENND